jgi:polyphosphate kinase 2 (PPK2 family)
VGRLDDLDLTLKLSSDEEARRLEEAQLRLAALRLTLGGLIGDRDIGPPVCVLFEGWDASGKGGAIKRLVARVDPRHVRVASFAAPTYDEKRHHWLWRFWPALPGWGGMAVLDRSWYGRVLVERVEGFAKKKEWKRAFGEINQFEKTLADDGTIVVKLFLAITRDEQAKRFDEREKDPYKRWKIGPEDWRNREHWDEYVEAAEEMFAETSTDVAPWKVIGADHKWHARLAVIRHILHALDEALPRKE